MAELEEVTRILSCSTHYQVLKLQLPGNPPVLVDAQQVRRRYKELAIRVHPDKNRATEAEAAFKRLSGAYECLVDEICQRKYLQEVQVQQPNSKTAKPKNKYKRKRKAQPQPKTHEREQLPKRRRTSEEIWKEFQREEEEMARQQFHAKGFDRVYDSTSKRENGAGQELGDVDDVEQTDRNAEADGEWGYRSSTHG
ncbi:hypothetical protein KRP22_008554 [Phytophthora ramorum]|uniref:DnaJ-like protein subfamily B member 1 n=1 Tax=Phytophthora ramorum TaxID=164328 RepID=UPI00309B49CD|nr:DnaJ-like protein subfamily B member 1 [Phytophthora ramorum]KAH7501912.1 DnaJ-like protein subfamily B member 1 [Phytophthora ramorum]